MKQFKLMTTLYGHTGDVKALCPTRDAGGFVSVSRDLTAKLWQCENPETSNQYTQTLTITTHKKYVNAVAVVYSLPGYPNGLIVTGSNDQVIAIHDIETNTNIAQLKEHDGAVCTLYFDNSSQSNLLYSGSFDSSAKVWNLNDLVKSDFKLKSAITIKEHSHTVWGVMALEKRHILLTASADKTIKQFRIDPAKQSYEFAFKYAGHSDCVRGLCSNPHNDLEFFSCSNDGSVIHWRLESPTPLRQIQVTGSFLYSINTARLHDADQNDCYIITSGEDRSLRIHAVGAKRHGDLVQSIILPCQTLWYTVALINGNIAVGCSDGSIRLFTQSEQLMASKSELESYEKELAGFAISTKTDENLAAIKLNDLPGVDALNVPGKKDGQSIVVNNNNEAEVYTWDSQENRWIKIGVAVGTYETGGGSSRKKASYLGKEYDYVFDIELDDTKASLKLPYNVSEDPYHAAQKFIHEHELSQLFLDQIAEFIINNTKSETIGDPTVTRSYYDPFTGENRYVPPAAQGSTNGSHSNGGFNDPFTGSGAYKTSAAMDTQSSEPPKKQQNKGGNEYYPHLEFILFDQKNSETILKKASELQQKSKLGGDLTKIENLLSNLDRIKSEDDFSNEINSLFEMVSSWPKESRFPLIDIIRISVLNKKVSEYVISNEACVKTLHSQLENADSPINSMLTLKVFCNLFQSAQGSESKTTLYFLSERQHLIKQANALILNASDNKSLQIAFSTLLLDYIVLVKKLAASRQLEAASLNEISIEFVQYLDELSGVFMNWDSEALFRVLVAFGTLISRSDSLLDYEIIRSVATSLENFKLACKEIDDKAQKFPDKVTSSARYLLKEL